MKKSTLEFYTKVFSREFAKGDDSIFDEDTQADINKALKAMKTNECDKICMSCSFELECRMSDSITEASGEYLLSIGKENNLIGTVEIKKD